MVVLIDPDTIVSQDAMRRGEASDIVTRQIRRKVRRPFVVVDVHESALAAVELDYPISLGRCLEEPETVVHLPLRRPSHETPRKPRSGNAGRARCRQTPTSYPHPNWTAFH
jgi:hypothetical protein